jgi:hypothetical protein
MAKRALPRAVHRLACEFKAEVAHRRALGDRHAEYHAQRPKTRAYKLMLDAGLSPRELVKRFARILRKCR